ncbi:MAG: hypothetical protein CK424_06305 [Legionella sp.]|nr:MAG: hypothetical protein CK424_06305 [Legionella sp.]
MSLGQFLLTIGVALWVFDSKKIPKLISNVAIIISICRQYYYSIAARFEQILEQALHQRQLERNEQKAQEVEKKGFM